MCVHLTTLASRNPSDGRPGRVWPPFPATGGPLATGGHHQRPSGFSCGFCGALPQNPHQILRWLFGDVRLPVAGDAYVSQYPSLGEVPGPGPVQDTAVVPDDDVADLPSVGE